MAAHEDDIYEELDDICGELDATIITARNRITELEDAISWWLECEDSWAAWHELDAYLEYSATWRKAESDLRQAIA